MKKVLTVAILFFIVNFIYSEPRNFTASLFCIPSEETTLFLEKMILEFESAEYSETAEIIQAYKEGWFGSAVLVELSDGNRVLISNKHVAQESGMFSIYFEPANDERIELEGYYPVFLDSKMDLAIIDIPDEPVFELAAIKINSNTEYSDGEDVYTAGFPILIEKSSWQITKGIISNSNASVEAIIDPEISSLIQHTAAINPGNSGGPLLIKEDDNWQLIGLNTWSVSNRDNTYFAIPADTIEIMIQNYQEDSMTKDEILEQRLTEFSALVNSNDYTDIKSDINISSDLMIREGWNSYLNYLEENTGSISSENIRFRNKSPLYTIKSSVYWWLWYAIKQQHRDGKEMTGPVESSYSSDRNQFNCTFLMNDSEYDLKMIYENGDWLIDNLDFPFPIFRRYSLEKEKKIKEPETFRFNVNDPTIGLSINIVPSFLNNETRNEDIIPSWGLGIIAAFPFNDYLSMDIALLYKSLALTVEEEISYNNFQMTDTALKGLEFGFGLSLGYPVEVGKSVLYPYIGGDLATLVGKHDISTLDEDLLIYLLMRYGGGLKYINREKGYGLDLGFFKQSGFNFWNSMTEFPSIDDIALELNFHWYYER